MNSSSEMVTSQAIADKLLADRIFLHFPHEAISRLIPYISLKRFAAGECFYRSGETATEMYLLFEGKCRLVSQKGREISPSDGRFGEEAGTEYDTYLTDALAETDCHVLVIPRKNLELLFETYPHLQSKFYYSLMHSFAEDDFHDAECTTRKGTEGRHEERESWVSISGWVLALLAPAAVVYFGDVWNVDKNALYFMAILSATMVMWIFSLVDEFIPGLFALLATLAMDLVPSHVILSGLASDDFLLAMSVLGLSSVIMASGFTYRLLLWMLMKLPDSGIWRGIGLFFIGFLLTPAVPSANVRVSLVAPLLCDMTRILHRGNKKAMVNDLAFAGFSGVSLMSAVFLSSKSVNFAVLALLPDQLKGQFQWTGWIYAALAAAGVIFVLNFLLWTLMYRSSEARVISKEQLLVQYSLLGKMDYVEWAALISVFLFIGGVATTSLHKIAAPWLGLSILYGMLLFGILEKKEFREKIDWPFLIYLGGITGITNTLNYLGLNEAITRHMDWLGTYMQHQFGTFVLILSLAMLVIRLIVPISATIALSATILMPIGEHYGINPWVIGFIVLVLGETWFLPYQCSYYLLFRQLARDDGKLFYDEKKFLIYNVATNFVKIAAIYASIPYWKYIGLL